MGSCTWSPSPPATTWSLWPRSTGRDASGSTPSGSSAPTSSGWARSWSLPARRRRAKKLWDFLLKRPRFALDLRHHRLASTGFHALRRLDTRSWNAALGPASPHLLMADGWDDFWRGRRTKFRKELERTERVAEREGIPVSVEMATDAEGIERLVPDVTAVFERGPAVTHPDGHALGDLPALHPRGLSRRRRATAPGAVRPVHRRQARRHAVILRAQAIMGGGGLRFDPAYGRFSPGQLLFRHVLEWAFSSGCDEFDFGPKDAPYKREWSTGAYDTVDIRSFSSQSIHAMHRAKAAVDATRRRRRDARRLLELAEQQASAT